MSPDDQFDVNLRIAKSRCKSLLRRMDDLWNKGKAENWDSSIMNYIMWVEHEWSRELDGLQKNLHELSLHRRDSD